MGLLDGLNNEDQLLLGLSLMAAGAPKPQRTSLGEGLLGAFQMAKQNQMGREDRAMKQQLMQAQLAETQAQAQQRAAQAQQAQQAQAQRAAFLQALQGGATTPQQALAGGGGPTQANAAQIGQQQTPNLAALAMRFPEQADLLQKLASAQDWGRPEVARTVETMRDGRPVQQQLDKFGRPVGDALAQWKAPVHVDTGGAVQFVDPVSLAKLGMLGKTMSPGEQASNAIARANLGIAQERLAMDRQQPKGQYDAERGLIIDPRTGQATPVTQGGQPIGAKNKEMTDSQAKALLFGQRAKDADAILNKMSAAGTNRPSIIKQGVENIPGVGGALGAAANAFIATPDQQSVEQAQRDFINAVLRRESGAVISQPEFENAKQQYFPQVGDTPQAIAQKARNRALATDLILREVPAQHRVQDAPQAPRQRMSFNSLPPGEASSAPPRVKFSDLRD